MKLNAALRRAALILTFLVTACASTDGPSGVPMMQTVQGNYLEFAKCAHRYMARDRRKVWQAQIIDIPEENAAEVWATSDIGVLIPATMRSFEQRYEQDGDQVKLTVYIMRSLNMETDRTYMRKLWDTCTKKDR